MPRYVALFGSINVAGNRLKMADLRAAFEAEEFENVETVVASDNVLFDHPERPDEGLEEKLGLMMFDRFAMKSPALVRSRQALAATIAENPFAADGADNQVFTLFLDGPLDPDGFDALLAWHEGPERIAMGTRAMHVDFAAGVADSTLDWSFIERRIGRMGTARTLRAMTRILAKMDER
ncbi:MAG: DUF1697 domain-containing protein [Novosphingobium sp.]